MPTLTSSSLKLALISTGVLSVAVILKNSVPALTDFAVSELPVMYSSVIAWLRPPYLYLVVNGIIISIVASSKLQLQKAEESLKQPLIIHPAPVADKISAHLSTGYIDGGSGYKDLVTETKSSDGDDGEVIVASKTVQPPLRSESIEKLFEKIEKEKPLVSKRFPNKKSVKSNTEGGKATVLGVSKSKRHDTLENTWKMITDGRAMPLNRHLKKSDTWDTNPAPAVPRAEKMKKSETFSEKKSKLSRSRQGSGKLRKEASLSQEELNRRVEAFISKFNEEMRLQRQESLNQYQEMIARGAY
ncbi:uncharacterized protein [Euphorbia lathyris]|uniref:uncharacterized protein n=1 Tax=Euphorbia lathyris TaxID=212925 RepID=UPI00331363BF